MTAARRLKELKTAAEGFLWFLFKQKNEKLLNLERSGGNQLSITETDVGAFLNVNLSKTQEIMIIKVEISEETMARMLTGKRVEGTIGYDLMTGRKDFNAFHRRRHDHPKDELLGKLPWGWVKESKANQKRYTSFPKNMSLEEKLALMDRENEMAKAVLIERELNIIEFC